MPLVVQVREGRCIALLEKRSSEISCPGLEGGEIGLYLTQTPLLADLTFRPLEFLVPHSTWAKALVRTGGSGSEQTIPLPQMEGEQRSARLGSITIWPTVQAAEFEVEAQIRRPDGELAGVLLLQPDSDDGWLFQVDSSNRQGIWWRWQDGEAQEPIRGVPYQKPLLSQAQSLLRRVLATFLGTLGILFAATLFQRAGRRIIIRPAGQLVAGLISATSQRTARIIMLIIILAVFGFTLWIAADILERIPHVQDSITYLFQAQTLARGVLWAPVPPLQEAFVQEFLTVWDGKWFGQYSPGYAALLAVGVLSGAPWLVNPWLAALSTALLYRLGALLYRRSIGLIAAAFALLSPFFISLSGSMMVHAAELFWTLLVMASWTLALRAPFRTRWAVLAGVAMGMLLLTRQITAVAVGVSFVALMILVEGKAQRAWRLFGKQAMVLLIAALPFALLLLGYQEALTGSPWQDPRLLGRPFDRPGFGDHIGERQNVFDLENYADGMAVTWYTDPEQPPRGHSLARGLYNTSENWEALAGYLFGWSPLLALSFCWILFLLGKPSRYDWILLAMMAAVMLVYIGYWTTGFMYGPRYYFAALPALLLLTARGLQVLARHYGKAATAVILAILVLFALIIYWPSMIAILDQYNFIGAEERSLVEAQIEEPALVFIPVEEWWDYGRFFSGNTPWLDGRIIYARDLDEKRNDMLRASYAGRAVYRWQPETRQIIKLE